MPYINGGLAFSSVLDVACLTPLDPELLPPLDEVLSLFPNPAHNILTVNSSSTLNDGSLRLYSATGKLIQQYSFDNWLEGEQQQLDIAQLPAGLYLLQLQTKEQLQTLKLMKN
jgi:hypothetical protein